jgi:hypothetical protein
LKMPQYCSIHLQMHGKVSRNINEYLRQFTNFHYFLR